MISVLTAAAIVGVVGIFIGLFLGAAGIIFKVEVNEKFYNKIVFTYLIVRVISME